MGNICCAGERDGHSGQSRPRALTSKQRSVRKMGKASRGDKFENQFNNLVKSLGDGQWTDPDFPPEDSSLVDRENARNPNFGQGVEWLRPDDIPSLAGEELALFHDKIEDNDIKQGALGDCYFLASLACMTEFPDRIRKIFVNQTKNEQGVYGVRMCKNGDQQLILVDDHFPCKYDTPVYSRANG